ncbi:Plasmodium exported protein, unknown function [Plasmodium vivax]|uniref:Variable surface protein Vir35 n=1 Tax=Plasmodium vivax TaxID=5855 RepID=A0A1G4EIZ1_PLAVI|nr:Plasmodium exported protein, unknown function [Plasmodium vivax]VUZ93664.1 Plasmodium exported protein, unknown function [Plasmodium vivax]
MLTLINYYQEINLNLTFFKIFTFIFLIWTYITYNNMDKFHNTLENKYEHGNILNRNHHRLLAKHEQHRELRYRATGKKLLRDSIGNSNKNIAADISISSQLNKKGSNNVETYMKNYKRRYEKKKGLYKLDCYCEKKVFDKLNYIYTLSDKMRNDKKGFKNKIRKKYGIGLIILSLLPALGLIYYILFGCGKGLRGIFELCTDGSHYNSNKGSHKKGKDCELLWRDKWDKTLGNIGFANEIFSYIMITIVLLFFIYILTKVIKYDKLKAGKGKMSINEYYRFCKEIFNIN